MPLFSIPAHENMGYTTGFQALGIETGLGAVVQGHKRRQAVMRIMQSNAELLGITAIATTVTERVLIGQMAGHNAVCAIKFGMVFHERSPRNKAVTSNSRIGNGRKPIKASLRPHAHKLTKRSPSLFILTKNSQRTQGVSRPDSGLNKGAATKKIGLGRGLRGILCRSNFDQEFNFLLNQ